MAGEVVIAAENLSRVYRAGEIEVMALRGVTFTIYQGDFVAIVGPSGSGKSTTMNILGCLDPPSGGSYHLDSAEVAGLSKNELAGIRNRKIGFVFQGFNLLPRTSALENVELPLLYGNYPSSQVRTRLSTEALQKVMLGERLHHLPTQLSGGEQQRVAIARALVTDPALIVADEPTGNLDARSAQDVLGILQSLSRDAGKTVIMVTHDPKAAVYGTRELHLEKGELARDSVPS